MQRQLKALVCGKLFSGEWGFIHCLAEVEAPAGRTAWVNDTGLVLKLGIPWVGLPEQACSSKRKKKPKQNESGDGREERI